MATCWEHLLDADGGKGKHYDIVDISPSIDPLWSSGGYPNVVKERHETNGKTLGKHPVESQLGPFQYSLNPDDSPIKESYYASHKSVVVFQNGTMTNLASNLTEKDSKISFKASYPFLSGYDPPYLYKWYSELVKAAPFHHVYLLLQIWSAMLPKMIVPW